MPSASFKNFQIGMVDDPSIEDQGGFEFASGMDIFSEPGTIKANYAMQECLYGAGATPDALAMAGFYSNNPSGLFVSMGNKVLLNNSGTFQVYLTNSQGAIKGFSKFGNYLTYASANYLGRANIGGAVSGQNDTLIDFSANPFISSYIPMQVQAGTLKIGSSRYVHSVDESFAASFQALKLKDGSFVSSLVNHFNNLYLGNANGDEQDSSVYGWQGTVLSTGSSLPDTVYEMRQRGMQALFSDSRTLFAFPDSRSEILTFDGAGFATFRKLFYMANKGYFFVKQEGIDLFNDTIVFAGESNVVPGIYQMKGGAICQGFVPSGYTPGIDAFIKTGFVRRGASVGSDQRTDLYISYYKQSDNSFHIEHLSPNRQNNAVLQTLWHRIATDNLKRWKGVKLNLKPLPAGCSVAVSYRTDKNAAFTNSGYTITAANQDKPVIFAAQPRSREIQFKCTYTTATTFTPELLSYDPIFEVLKTNRK